MRLLYVLLSPTFGMHQYTADLANRMGIRGQGMGIAEAVPAFQPECVETFLVTTDGYPASRYGPVVTVRTPVATRDRGLSRQGLDRQALRRVMRAIEAIRPDIVHFTGPHLWNAPLLAWLRRQRVKTVHSLHDLDPHAGLGYGRLLHVWNAAVLRLADRLLVHGELYRHRLLGQGLAAERVWHTPLLHGFWGHGVQKPAQTAASARQPRDKKALHFLFFGRLERYKGVDVLLQAWEFAKQANAPSFQQATLTLAGPGRIATVWESDLPPGVDVQAGLVEDETALEMFAECDMVILPYTSATQSALVAAAYQFGKPVLATRSGALSEYVLDGRTGFLVAPGDARALADALIKAAAAPPRLRDLGHRGRAWYDERRAQEWATIQQIYSSLFHGEKL